MYITNKSNIKRLEVGKFNHNVKEDSHNDFLNRWIPQYVGDEFDKK